ncbi:efflux transporter outer membrane subunit [Ottowia sp.]|uniref:efflux transporter outer membrane subunit n=1 Tax=Ottowia sp. TaxID=1898956 RepID=UPI003A85DE57
MAATLILSACSFAPQEQTPAVSVPAAWKEAAPQPGWINAEQAMDWHSGQWWRLFGDAQLDALMPQVDVGNQNLAQAVANVAQAQALLRQQRAQLWPTVSASGSSSRAGGGDMATTHGGSVGLSASWTPDLWGKLGDAARAQGASVQASEADLAAARLSAQGSLAQTYFAVREADAEMALLQSIIAGYERNARITQNRYEEGVVARTDALQAQSTLENARANLIALQRSRQQSEHAIALLLGRAPADFALPPQTWTQAVPDVPVGVPSALLLRRPDVAAAERDVAAANARIGVARAAYFPDLTLSGGLSASGTDLLNAMSVPSLMWSLGLSLTQLVFDGGARTAAVDQAIAAHQGATAAYRQTALDAMREVEDQLTALRTLAAQTERVRAAAKASSGAEQRILNSYQAGLSAYTEVVIAQASALNARRSVMQLQLQRQQSAVTLVQALGGGWQVPWGISGTSALQE